MKSMHKGVCYVAFGGKHTIMALGSALSLKGRIPCHILTNQEWLNEETLNYLGIVRCTISLVDSSTDTNRLYKTNLIDYSPYEHTIYLDTDTSVIGDIDGLFRITEYYDVAFRANSHPYMRTDYGFDLPFSANIFTHFNGGVFSFIKGKRSEMFFKSWNEEFKKLGNKADQPALATTLFKLRDDITLLPLGGIYNCTPYYLPRDCMGDAVVEHYSIGFMKGLELHRFAKHLYIYHNTCNPFSFSRKRRAVYLVLSIFGVSGSFRSKFNQ